MWDDEILEMLMNMICESSNKNVHEFNEVVRHSKDIVQYVTCTKLEVKVLRLSRCVVNYHTFYT